MNILKNIALLVMVLGISNVQAEPAIASNDGAVNSQNSAESKKKLDYRGETLHQENIPFLDSAISFQSKYVGAMERISATAETIIINIKQQKSLDAKVAVEEQLTTLLDTFATFAPLIKQQAVYILPIIELSLNADKIKKRGIVLRDGTSYLKLYIASPDDAHKFFQARIKTQEELFQFSCEIYIFLRDFLRSMPKARIAYKNYLDNMAKIKEIEQIEQKEIKGDKEPMTPV